MNLIDSLYIFIRKCRGEIYMIIILLIIIWNLRMSDQGEDYNE